MLVLGCTCLTVSSVLQAHLGVRLKKEGYYVIGADWKEQEYFEKVYRVAPDLV